MRNIRLTCLVSGWLTAVLLFPNHSAKADGASDTIQILASQIHSILQANELPTKVSVGAFDSTFGPSATLGIQQQLTTALGSLGVVTASNSDIEVTGSVHRNRFMIQISGQVYVRSTNSPFDFADAQVVGDEDIQFAAKKQQQLAQAQTKLLTAAGKLNKNQKVSTVLTDRESLITLTAPTYEVDMTDVPGRERAATLKDEIELGIDSPDVYVQGSKVSAYADSRFAIELRVKDQYGKYSIRPRITNDKDGHAFVHLKVGDRVGVRITNSANYNVAAKLMVDGLHSFSFSKIDEYRKNQMYVIQSGQTGLITGWHLDDQNVAEFNITTLPDSAAAELNKGFGGVGVITVMFYPSWAKGTQPPQDEIAGHLGEAGRGIKAVGKGNTQSETYTQVQALVGKTVVSAISVRYEHP